ncbi:MAG TPA: hypothetical protein VD887_03405 [Allosphingosinicella sp.]|nr:hypothetical protein [Allosphingosinicella sp.]
MSNVAGKAYAMNVVTPVPPGRTWLSNLIFMFTRSRTDTLLGLLGLEFIHFARWVLIRRDQWPDFGQPKEQLQHDYMLFCSNFNGTWDQYIDAFSDALPSGLDILWYTSVKYPHSIPITPFKNYIRANQIDTDYYYNATPGAAQKDIKAALRLRSAVIALAEQHGSMTPAAFAAAYRKMLVAVQNELRGQGEAPVASNDTAAADLHRLPFVQRAWGAR